MKASLQQKLKQNPLWKSRLQKIVTFTFSVLVMVCFALPGFAQNIRVKGRVTDENGKAVARASVAVKGSTTGTTADDNGNFEISAPANGTLVISAVNFTTQEVKVNNKTTVDVSIVSLAKTESEVIVVGYGTQRKEAVTGSVASVTGDKMREIPAPNISQALQGRVAGVEMSQNNTRPGATMQIRIRGTRSLTPELNNPLIVLDGIPYIGSLGDINPNDVKSIEILKDASATAIYGSRGANGVILVTTDKGGRGRKPRISYNGYHGMQKIFAKYPMMDGPQFVKLRTFTPTYQNGPDEANDLNTDWQDLLYQTGIITDNSIGLSGGSETGSYNFGAGYYLNQGVIPTQQYKRYSFRGALDQQVGKYFRVGFTTYENYNETAGNQVSLYNTLSMSPNSTPVNPDGTMKRSIRMQLDNQYIFTKDAIQKLTDNDQWLNETRGFGAYNAIYGEVKAPFLDGLKYRINLGLDYIQSNNGAYTGQGVGDGANPGTVSSASVDNQATYHWTVENILSYDRTFGGKHTINALALYSAEQNKFTRSNMSAQDIPVDAFEFYNLGQANGQITINPANQQYALSGLTSWMGRVMYSYDNRYMITATIRSDASSRLAPGYQRHTYPAVSVGWNIANESFMKDRLSFFNILKLRAGFGQTSNQAINPYATLGLLSTRPYNFGTSYATGYYVSILPNPSLGWEFSKTWNVGLDFSILKSRLSGTVEWYLTKTQDILLPFNLPATSGVTSVNSNIGATQNKGIEVSLNGVILNNPHGVTWEAGINFYTNNNKITSLATGQTQDIGNGWFVGHNINAIYDYKKIGLWQDKDQFLTLYEPGGNVGMIKVLYTGGYNADGSPKRAIGTGAGYDDRQITDIDPDWQGGFNTRVSYKGFDLGIVGIYRHGGILVSNVHGPNGYLNLLSGRRNNLDVDYWTPNNTDAKYPKPGGIVSGDNAKYASTLALFDGSFLKIRTITLGYDFNHLLIKNPAVKLRMYFTVQNPFVMFSPFTKESGLDPETNSTGNQNVATGGYQARILTVGFNTPSTRNYIVGVNLNF